MGLMQAKAQFKNLPKEQLIAQIDAQKSAVPAEMVGPLLQAERETMLAKIEAAKAAPKPEEKTAEQKEEEAIDAYLEEILTELSEDEYADLATTVSKAMPTRLFNIYSEGASIEDLEAEARKSYREFKADKSKSKAAAELKSKTIEGVIFSEEVFAALEETFNKVSGEKIYAMAEEIVEKLDAKDIAAIAENGLVAVEDALKAAKKTGNPLQVGEADAAKNTVAAFGRVAQIVEDAVVNADVLPELDLAALYKAKKAEAALKGPK
jgi:DNA-binding phage protein